MAQPSKRIVIWGAGGHGRVVADLVRAQRYSLIGFVDADPASLGCVVEPGGGEVVLSEEEFLFQVRQEKWHQFTDYIALAIGDNSSRLACLGAVGDLRLPVLAHPSASISPSARINRGTVVMPRAVINAGARVGEGVIINTGSIVEHDCMIDDGAHISPGAVLTGSVRVGTRSWIGAGAVVIQGVEIGADVVVGAGAVVTRDVPAGATVVGVPAAPIKTRKLPCA